MTDSAVPATHPADEPDTPDHDKIAVLEALPAEQRQVVLEIIQAQSSHSGPLPSPRQLAEYEQAMPGLAERIVRLTEGEQEHRHHVVNTALERGADLRDRGQWMAMAALVVVLLFCVFLALIGKPELAAGVSVALVAAVVGIFVTGRRADIKEREIDTEAITAEV